MANEVVTLNAAELAAENWRAEREIVVRDAENERGFGGISSPDALESVAEIVKRAKKLVKTLSAKRLELTRPADEFKKALIAAEKSEAKALNDIIAKGDGAMSAYALEQERLRREEERRREAEERARAEAEFARQQEEERRAAANAAFGLDAPTVPPPPPSPAPIVPVPVETPKASAASASFTEKWNFEVLDANEVPRELCSPDPAKIRAALAARKAEGYRCEQILIKGVRVFPVVQVRSR